MRRFTMFEDDLYIYFVPAVSEKDAARLIASEFGRLSLFTIAELIILKSSKTVIKSRHF